MAIFYMQKMLVENPQQYLITKKFECMTHSPATSTPTTKSHSMIFSSSNLT